MSEYGWVSLIALTGWLVLAAGSYRVYRMGARKTFVMAGAWLAIFLLVAGLLSAMGA
jgi:hypothetical protein